MIPEQRCLSCHIKVYKNNFGTTTNRDVKLIHRFARFFCAEHWFDTVLKRAAWIDAGPEPLCSTPPASDTSGSVQLDSFAFIFYMLLGAVGSPQSPMTFI